MVNYILRVIDFETTGIPTAEISHSVCEYGYVDIIPETKNIYSEKENIVKPSTPMDIEARSVHHISDELIFNNGIEWNDAYEDLTNSTIDTKYIYVAHNADFEKKFFNPENSIWIDTYKVALKLYPDAPRHTNSVLKYYLEITDKEHHHPPHRS